MDQSLDDWFDEYQKLSDALQHFGDRILPKLYGPGGPESLTPAEGLFSNLWYYWSAALVNNGDVFAYMPFIIHHKADFVAIGADGTLEAVAKLMPYYHEQQKLQDENEKRAYSWRTKDKRASVEELAEGVHEFARLLLAYAKKNLSEDK